MAGMTKTSTTAFWYGNRLTAPKAPMGITPRGDYNALADANTINSGGTGGGSVYTSIFLVAWGEGRALGIYPEGSLTGGIEHEDIGRQLIHNSAGAAQLAWVSHFYFNFGLAIMDPAAVQRIVNVIAAASGTGAFDEDHLIEAINNIEGEGEGAYMYFRKNIRKNMMIIAKDKANVRYTPDNLFGRKWVTEFLGVEARISEQIVQTEAEVS